MPESSFEKKKTVIVYILFYMQITTNTVLAIHPEIANLQLILYMQYAGPDFHLEALGCFKLGPILKDSRKMSYFTCLKAGCLRHSLLS